MTSLFIYADLSYFLLIIIYNHGAWKNRLKCCNHWVTAALFNIFSFRIQRNTVVSTLTLTRRSRALGYSVIPRNACSISTSTSRCVRTPHVQSQTYTLVSIHKHKRAWEYAYTRANIHKHNPYVGVRLHWYFDWSCIFVFTVRFAASFSLRVGNKSYNL